MPIFILFKLHDVELQITKLENLPISLVPPVTWRRLQQLTVGHKIAVKKNIKITKNLIRET